MNASQFRRSRILFLSFLLVACESPSGPDRVLEPGIIFGFNLDDPHIALTLKGDSLAVQVTTYGDGCRSKGETRVSLDVDNRSATIAPFDWVATSSVCVTILNSFDHSAKLALEGAGEWRVVVAGWDHNGQPIQFQFPFLVAE